MADPLLIPAYPQVLAPGLLVGTTKSDRVGPALSRNVVMGCVAISFYATFQREWETVWVQFEDVRLDLRVPAVRDAVVRALHKELQPHEAVPFSAPLFQYAHDGVGRRRWELSADPDSEHGGDLPLTFLPSTEGHDFNGNAPREYNCIIVPALASIPLDSPDRDLLAIAVIAAHVLGSEVKND